MPTKLVTLTTDGLTNHIVLPNGQKLNLGAVSPLRLVAECCWNSREARDILETLLKDHSVMVRVDTDRFEKLIQPERRETYPYRKLRWATKKQGAYPFRPFPGDTKMDANRAEAVSATIDKIENQISSIEKKVGSKTGSASEVEHLAELVEGLKTPSPKDQSSNDSFYFGRAKNASVVFGDIENALDKVAEAKKMVDILEAKGRPFNADRARTDLLGVASKIRTLLASKDAPNMREVRASVERATELHSLFAGAR